MTRGNDPPATRLAHHLRWLENLPPGWHALYRGLAERLARQHPDVEVTYAGAKLAMLQVLTRGGYGAHGPLVWDARQASALICELCGRPGRVLVDKGGWCRALCPDHSSGFRVPNLKGQNT